jgi:dTDP-4-dehydrorhamnose 3,5-epimerase
MASGEWRGTAIDGVVIRHVPTFTDERGWFMELWRASLTDGLAETFVQANVSRSRAGVLRGMHFHRRQADLWMPLEGNVLAATTDLRGLLDGQPASGEPRVASQLLELGPGDALFIPRLVAHGFWAREDTLLLYLVSSEYDGSDEQGFAWNDPAAGIDWPRDRAPMISERDTANPSLSELAARRSAQHS